MKRVLVTGASGFVGRQSLVPLLERGYEVHAVSSKNTSAFPIEVHQHTSNLLNKNEVVQLINQVQPTQLLHFAWYAVPGKYWTSSENLEWVKATLDLVQEFVKVGGKRLVIAGTCAEYDWNDGICDELKTPLLPNTLYGTCKAALFQLINAYATQMKLSFAWGRIFFLYGPYENPVRLVPDVIHSLSTKGVVKCTHGKQIRDFLHVEDVGHAFAALLDNEVNGPINIASGQGVSLEEVIYKIARRLNCEAGVELGAIKAPLNEPAAIIANNTKLKSELNWKPKYTLDQGLDQTIEWWAKKSTVSV